MAFPKIIHQTWKDDQVPGWLQPYQESWKRLNPTWEYRLWTDAANDALVHDEFPELLSLYRSLPRAIHRADFARILYLWKYGGLYVDLDIEAFRPADILLDTGTCMLGCEPELHASRLRNVERVVCNAAMASEPGHPFWEKMIDEIGRRSSQGEKDPVWMTGPLCLQAAYESHGHQFDVRLWDPDVFFPLPDLYNRTLRLSSDQRRYFERMATTGCYPWKTVGVHHWAHTWIPAHPFRRSLSKVWRAISVAKSVAQGSVTADEMLRPKRYGLEFPENRFLPRESRRLEYQRVRDEGYEAARRSSLAIGVLIHDRIDLARILRARLEALAGLFVEARVYILGEDSTDGTEKMIRAWSGEAPSLVRRVPPVETSAKGVARIAALRNALLDAMDEDEPTDFVAMIDGDLEGPVSVDGVAHTMHVLEDDPDLSAVAAFGINNWIGFDIEVPFLGYNYYDPVAFREQHWQRTSSDFSIRWRLRGTRRGDPLIQVKSGFAGFAIYRVHAIKGLRYEIDGRDCEHVGFHRALAERGGRMVVNPAMLLLAGRQGHHAHRQSNAKPR